MKELVVISGKGGTGKTSLVASFAVLADDRVMADCDVDAADLHLVLEPSVRYQEDFCGGKLARIAPEACTACGTCGTLCRFGAVTEEGGDGVAADRPPRIDPMACEGCGVCAWFCPEEAIAFEDAVNGQWFISETRCGTMVHAKLGVAEENSGKLVTLVRNQARRLAEEQGARLIMVDGAPGIGCPVIASLAGADLALVITEPTLSGMSDFIRVTDLTGHFGIATAVCVNKWDLNPEITDRIETEARERGVATMGRVRYDGDVTRAQVRKQTVVEYTDGPVSQDVRSVWRQVESELEQTSERRSSAQSPLSLA